MTDGLGDNTVWRDAILRYGEMRIARCGIRAVELIAYGVMYGTSVTVSSQQPSRSPTHKLGCDTPVPFSWRPSLLAATPSPRPGRTICSSLCHSLSSWTVLQQSWSLPGIIVDRPHVCQLPINQLKVLPTSVESAHHIGTRDIMPSLAHTCRNTLECQFH